MAISPRDASARIAPDRQTREQWRSQAQIDIDRILYSPEFRRLGGVTQVVPPEDEYHFHDRLSHSLKVAQVAATLARMVVSNAKQGDGDSFANFELEQWVDPDHCFAAGLAHDIGHPPFGHAGEAALQGILKSKGDRNEQLLADEQSQPRRGASDSSRLAQRSFEGNAQSTRVVSELSFRGDQVGAGLNLTLRTVAAIAKYPWVKGGHPVSQPKLERKWSFYPEAASVLQDLIDGRFVQSVIGKDGSVAKVHRWVEAEIMDWADDISYAVHDLDDFYRARLIPLSQILSKFENTEPNFPWCDRNFRFVNDDYIREALQFAKAKMTEFQKYSEMFDNCREGGSGRSNDELNKAFDQIAGFADMFSLSSSFSATHEAQGDLRRFSSGVIRYLSEAASIVVNDDTRRVQLRLEPTAVLVAEFFKALNSYYVIESINLAAMQRGQEVSLEALFSHLFDLAARWVEGKPNGMDSGRLPARLRSYLKTQIENDRGDSTILGSDDISELDKRSSASEEKAAEVEDCIAIAVLDYIASLRDGQAACLVDVLSGKRSSSPMAGGWLNT